MPRKHMTEEEASALDIPGYEGKYKISRNGIVFNAVRHSVLKQQNYNGYCYVTLYSGKKNSGKLYRVHRLVALTYIPNPDNLPQVNHKDENKQNNSVENLEWCSARYNTNYGNAIEKRMTNRTGKGARKPVRCIETGKVYASISHAERETGISARAIRWCVKGIHKTSGKLHWEYA